MHLNIESQYNHILIRQPCEMTGGEMSSISIVTLRNLVSSLFKILRDV